MTRRFMEITNYHMKRCPYHCDRGNVNQDHNVVTSHKQKILYLRIGNVEEDVYPQRICNHFGK